MRKKLRLMFAVIAAFAVLAAAVFAAEAAENETEKMSQTSDFTKYQHEIDMNFLSDYIYGGSKTTEGEEINLYVQVPT